MQLQWSSPHLPSAVLGPRQLWEREVRALEEEAAMAELAWAMGGDFGSPAVPGRPLHGDDTRDGGFEALPEEEREGYAQEAADGLQAFCRFWLSRTSPSPVGDAATEELLASSLAGSAAAWGELPLHERWLWEVGAAGAQQRSGEGGQGPLPQQLALLGMLPAEEAAPHGEAPAAAAAPEPTAQPAQAEAGVREEERPGAAQAPGRAPTVPQPALESGCGQGVQAALPAPGSAAEAPVEAAAAAAASGSPCCSPARQQGWEEGPQTPRRGTTEPWSPQSEAPTSPPRGQKRLVESTAAAAEAAGAVKVRRRGACSPAAALRA